MRVRERKKQIKIKKERENLKKMLEGKMTNCKFTILVLKRINKKINSFKPLLHSGKASL